MGTNAKRVPPVHFHRPVAEHSATTASLAPTHRRARQRACGAILGFLRPIPGRRRALRAMLANTAQARGRPFAILAMVVHIQCRTLVCSAMRGKPRLRKI